LFHRARQSLIRRYGPLDMILALPEHHDGFVEVTPRWSAFNAAALHRRLSSKGF
jgi:hypothetical protein